jgi:predicted enzyme related to lactoylglutathione lyase
MKNIGNIFWQDLTIDKAEEIRDFYCSVVGWKFEKVNMGEYNDFNIINPNDNNKVVAGICNKRGVNNNLPSQWLNYIKVESIENSINKCLEFGGKIIDGPRMMGNSKFVVIQDPAGAYLGLIEENDDSN